MENDDAFFVTCFVGESGNFARFGVSTILLLDGVFMVQTCADVERRYTPFLFTSSRHQAWMDMVGELRKNERKSSVAMRKNASQCNFVEPPMLKLECFTWKLDPRAKSSVRIPYSAVCVHHMLPLVYNNSSSSTFSPLLAARYTLPLSYAPR